MSGIMLTTTLLVSRPPLPPAAAALLLPRPALLPRGIMLLLVVWLLLPVFARRLGACLDDVAAPAAFLTACRTQHSTAPGHTQLKRIQRQETTKDGQQPPHEATTCNGECISQQTRHLTDLCPSKVHPQNKCDHAQCSSRPLMACLSHLKRSLLLSRVPYAALVGAHNVGVMQLQQQQQHRQVPDTTVQQLESSKHGQAALGWASTVWSFVHCGTYHVQSSAGHEHVAAPA
jgi:hypothetical protein